MNYEALNDLRTLFFLLFASILLSSCFGEDTTRELLTSGSWENIDEISYDPIDDTETSVIADCRKDDVYSFNEDGRFFIEVETLPCAPKETNVNGTWELSENERQLTLTYESEYQTTFMIGKLTKNKMELYLVSDLPDFGWRTTFVFSR